MRICTFANHKKEAISLRAMCKIVLILFPLPIVVVELSFFCFVLFERKLYYNLLTCRRFFFFYTPFFVCMIHSMQQRMYAFVCDFFYLFLNVELLLPSEWGEMRWFEFRFVISYVYGRS